METRIRYSGSLGSQEIASFIRSGINGNKPVATPIEVLESPTRIASFIRSGINGNVQDRSQAP